MLVNEFKRQLSESSCGCGGISDIEKEEVIELVEAQFVFHVSNISQITQEDNYVQTDSRHGLSSLEYLDSLDSAELFISFCIKDIVENLIGADLPENPAHGVKVH